MWTDVVARLRTRYGVRGQRIGEATNPGPGSGRRRTQRLRALPWSWDSDIESDRREIGNPRDGHGQ